MIVFSSTDRDSFEAVPNWKKKVEAECGPIAMCLVQNKVKRITSNTISFVQYQ